MPTERISPWREIRSLAQGRWREISIIALLVSLGTLASIFEPWIYSAIIDDIAGILVADNSEALIGRFVQDVLQTAANLGASAVRILSAPLRGSLELEARTIPEAFATIATGAVLMVLMRIVAQACAAAGDNRAARLGSDVEQDIIGKTYRHVLRLPLGFFQRRASGTIAKQVDQSDAIAPIVSGVAEEVWPELFTLVAILSIMLVVDPSLALVTLVSVPVYAAVTWRMTRALDAGMDEYYAAWDDIVARLQESIQGIKTVRAFGAADHEASELNEHMGEAYEAYLARTRLQNRYGLLQSAIIVITQGSVLAIGGYQALQHQLSPGAVVLFLTYLDRLYGPIESLTELYTSLQLHLASLRRARRLLSEPTAPGEDLPSLPAPRGAIDVRNVTFGYNGHRVLDGITFSVAPGEKIAIVGPSGAGKTTLTDLVAGLYHPQEGSLRIDDTDTSRVAPSSVQRYVRGVAVDGTIFRRSVRDNVRYGRFEATDAQVQDAIQLAGLSDVVKRLPDGLDTVIGERGLQLSAGERQRVLLARAILSSPSILVLDEATANLDYRTEEMVRQALARASKGRTTLLVSHRKSMVADVDRVLVLRNGRIEQDGTPQQLRAVDGYFRQMMEAEGATA